MQSDYQAIYDDPSLWEGYGHGREAERERISFILNNLPQDYETVVDVGCGSGVILNRIKGKKTIGLDGSLAALQHVRGPRLRGDVTYLPFRDDAFDLVLSCEVLEHLADDFLVRAVRELFRASRKYVLITVPYLENLSLHTLRCPECGYVFHRNGHLQQFNMERLLALTSDYRCVALTPFGPSYRRYSEASVSAFQKFGCCYGDPMDNSVCPKCRNKEFSEGNNLERRVRAYARKMTRPFHRPEENWLFALLKR